MRWDYNDYYLLMQNQKSSIKSSQNFIISIPYLMSRPNHTYKANIGCTTQPLEADQFLKKDNSLFDPFQPTINQQDNTTSQKSADNCEQAGEKDREDQPQQCRKCNYNFNQESQCRNLPFQMSPPSGEDSPDEKYEQDNCSANQADKKRRRMGRKNVENADFEPKNVIQQDQNTSKRKTAKKITPDRPKNTHKNISCKCKKTHCIKSYCQCFLSNLGCNANCECLDCANWAQVPKSKKKMQSPTLEKKQQKSGHSCQCKKTNCVKNYCECYHSGTKCGQGCHCTDCHNKGV